jgi:hypothetical protein
LSNQAHGGSAMILEDVTHIEAAPELVWRVTAETNVLRVEAAGALAVLLWPVLRLAVRRALSDENAGLKQHCEQAARAAAPA